MFSNGKSKIVFIVTGLFLTNLSFAQDRLAQELSLKEAIENTVVGSYQIKLADYELQSALMDVENTKSFYQPQIQAAITSSGTNLPLNAFGSRLQQGAIEQSDFNPSSLNKPSSITNVQSRLMIQQPIMNLNMRAMKEATIFKSKAYEQKAKLTKNRLRYQVEQTYLQLQLLYEAEQVLLNAKATTEANLKLVADNVEAGYLHKVDELSVALRFNQIENQLFETRSNIQSVSDQLSFLMGREIGTLYIPIDELVDNKGFILLETELSLGRSDLQAMKYEVLAKEQMLKSTQKLHLPKINATGYYELNNPMNFSDAQHGFMVMVQASWNLFDGNMNKNAVQKARIEMSRSQKSLDKMIAQNKLELEGSKRTILNARNKISLAEKAVEHSKEYLRIKTDRFGEGLEKTADLLEAETAVMQKQMNYVEAVYQFQLANAQLKFLLEKE